MTLEMLLAIAAVIALAVIATVIYIMRVGGKPTRNAAVFYQELSERFDTIPPLSDAKNSAKTNAKTLSDNLKLLWNKKELDEIDLKPELSGLTQADALDFVTSADELFLEKTDRAFIYDIHDAREGTLRLFSVEKNSEAYQVFVLGQAIVRLLKEKLTIEEFPDIELPEEAASESLLNLESFVIANSGVAVDPEELYSVTATLSAKFGDDWNVYLISEDVLKFERALPEEEAPVVQAKPADLSPFAAQKEAKKQAAEEAAAALLAAEVARKFRWEQAEEEKKQNALRARQEAIASGQISTLAEKPQSFLSQAIEIAADKADLLSIDEEVEIRKFDRIGTPTLFTVYSSELIEVNETPFIEFTDSLIASLKDNFGGEWAYEVDNEPASSISFAQGIA